MGELTKKVAQNALYQTGGKALSVLLGAISFSFMARFLGESGYGDYTTITTFAIFFSTMADMGFYLIAIREISKPKADDKKIFGNAFTMRLIASLFFVLLAPAVSLLFDYPQHVKLGILVAGIGTFFISINQMLVAIFQKQLRTDQVALAEVVSRALFLGLVIGLTYMDYGVLAFVWALGISSFVNFALLYLSSRRFLKFRLRFEKNRWKRIISVAWPIGIVIIVNLFYFRFNVILLSIYQPAQDVGIFGAAYKIIEILIALPAIFVGLIIPILSRYLVENKKKFRDVFERSFNALILVAVPIAVGTQFIADSIIRIVGGDGFQDSVRVLQILIIAVLAMFLSSLAINTVIVINKQRSMIWVSVVAATASIILNVTLIPIYTYIGTAITAVLIEFGISIMAFLIVFRAMKLRPKFTIPLKAVFAGCIMGLTLWLMGLENDYLNMLIGATVYMVVIIVMKAFSFSDVKDLVRISRKQNV